MLLDGITTAPRLAEQVAAADAVGVVQIAVAVVPVLVAENPTAQELRRARPRRHVEGVTHVSPCYLNERFGTL